jgi:RNA polymerase sigma-70 factor (sigma-E family)
VRLQGVDTDTGIVSLTMEQEAPRGKLAELYERHAPAALGFATLLTGDRAAAEDLVQEAFIRVAGRFRHIRMQGSFEAYLRTTIVNLHTSGLRRRKLERQYLKREANRPTPASMPMPDIDTRQEMRRALQLLPPRQRAAIVLRYYADMSERQVAEELGCSAAAARSLVARGMEVLRAEIRSES